MRIVIICILFFLATSIFAQYPDLKINEFLASNLSTIKDNHGDYDDWIEIYNLTDTTIDLSGYYLSDDPQDLMKWALPFTEADTAIISGGGYLILWADGEPLQGVSHLDFKLSSAGEWIGLIAPDGVTVIDSLLFEEQFTDVSYGRYPDGAEATGFMNTPTPGDTNSSIMIDKAAAPYFSLSSGFYSTAQSLAMWSDEPGAGIFYSIDASIPDTSDIRYQSVLSINSRKVIRGIAAKEDYINSDPESRIFFFDENYYLPVMSLITDPDNFWDAATGIYVNYNKTGRDWERPVENLYFLNKNLQYDIGAGIRIQGSSSRFMAKKSFRLFLRNGYGADRLEYDFFNNPKVSTFKNLVLRAGYDDDITMFTGTLLRDPLVNEQWRQLGFLTSAGDFASLFINDEYWGIYNIRESINEYFLQDHLGWKDFDLIRFDKSGIEIKYGDRTDWDVFWNFIENSDFTRDSVFQQVCKILDIENFLALQALVQCTQYRSWSWGAFTFKEKTPGSKWRYTIWDMDRPYTLLSWDGFSDYNRTINEAWANLIMKQLLKNTHFRHAFINRVSDYLNSMFLPENVIQKLDSLVAVVEPEMPLEIERWNGSMSRWNNNLESLRNFARNRPDVVRNQIINQYGGMDNADSFFNLTIDIKGGDGRIKVNSLNPQSFPWSGLYYEGSPVSLEAIPEQGFEFIGWIDNTSKTETARTINLSSDTVFTAVFQAIPEQKPFRLIMPAQMIKGQFLPVIVQALNEQDTLNTDYTAYVNLQIGGQIVEVPVKKGAGAAFPVINETGWLDISIDDGQEIIDLGQVNIIDSAKTIDYSGTLNTGNVIWNDERDHHIITDLTIPAGCNLTILPGVRVLLDEDVNIIIQGQLNVTGSSENPVVFSSSNIIAAWGGIEFFASTSAIENCFFLNGGGDQTKGWAHMNLQPILFAKDYSEISLNRVFIMNAPGKALGSYYSRLICTNSVISHVRHGGEFHYTLLDYDRNYIVNIPADSQVVDVAGFDFDNDGMHIDYVYPGANRPSRIKNSFFITGWDDAIDHNIAELEIHNCWLQDWNHEGVAASGGNYVKVFNTVAMECDNGFEAGHGAPQVYVDHSVAVNNGVGLKFGDGYTTPATGHITMTNSILYGNTANVKNYTKSLAGPREGAIDVSYTMTNDNYDSDDDYNLYPNCIIGIPEFDARMRLTPGSDGSGMAMMGLNMGIIDSAALISGPVVINEIMYNASSSRDTRDWIELFNPQTFVQDLSGWQIRDDQNTNVFEMPSGIQIQPFGYVVICRDTTDFKRFHPDIKNFYGEFVFGFGGGDQVRLYAPNGVLSDSVSYLTTLPWPVEADGNGSSLELTDAGKDHTDPENWQASRTFGGTPGRKNSTLTSSEPEKPQVPLIFHLAQNYPNPFNPQTKVSFSIPETGRVKLTIYDILGREIKVVLNKTLLPGDCYIEVNGNSWASGIYFYRLELIASSGMIYQQTKKMLLIR